MSTAQQVLTGPMIQSGTSRVSLTVIQERARKKKWKKEKKDTYDDIIK